MMIGPDAKPVRALFGKNARDLLQPIGDIAIGAGGDLARVLHDLPTAALSRRR